MNIKDLTITDLKALIDFTAIEIEEDKDDEISWEPLHYAAKKELRSRLLKVEFPFVALKAA